MDILIVEDGAVIQECNYPTGSIRLIEASGVAWAASDDSFDADAWKPQSSKDSTSVKITVTDPEGVVDKFCVTVDCRNVYFSQLLLKHLRECFCPVDVSERVRQARVHREEEQAKLTAERERLEVEREIERQTEEQVKRDAEQEQLKNDGSNVLVGWLVLAGICLAAVVLAVTLERDPRHRSSDPSLPPNAVRAGSFAAWTTPIARRVGEQPKAGDSLRPGQDYYVVIQVKVPRHQTEYDVSDLSGRVTGSDGYIQKIPALAFIQEEDGRMVRARIGQRVPIVRGVVKIFIRVPGAAASVKDTIRIRSDALGEEQTLTILHGDEPTHAAAKLSADVQLTHATGKLPIASPSRKARHDQLLAPFRVRVFTTIGRVGSGWFDIEIYPNAAPTAAKRFRSLVESDYYEGGRFSVEQHQGLTRFINHHPGVEGNASPDDTPSGTNQLPNLKSNVGFRVLEQPQRRTEFFVNLVDNPQHDRAGYEMFGKVVEGMSVVESLRNSDRITAVALR